MFRGPEDIERRFKSWDLDNDNKISIQELRVKTTIFFANLLELLGALPTEESKWWLMFVIMFSWNARNWKFSKVITFFGIPQILKYLSYDPHTKLSRHHTILLLQMIRITNYDRWKLDAKKKISLVVFIMYKVLCYKV